eukprot:755875-Hanusia_phi.AAC.2
MNEGECRGGGGRVQGGQRGWEQTGEMLTHEACKACEDELQWSAEVTRETRSGGYKGLRRTSRIMTGQVGAEEKGHPTERKEDMSHESENLRPRE